MSRDEDFGALLSAVARDLLAESTQQSTLQRVVDLAAVHLDGEVYASVSLVRRRQVVDTPASSDGRAERADQLQYELGQGPCLDAIWERATFPLDDLLTDERYPAWSRRVVEETGIRSSLSLRLFTAADTLGALNLYSPAARAFDEQDVLEGQLFAAQAAVAVQYAVTDEQLRAAIATRTMVGQAQGILMERFTIGADQAFAVLTRVSQHTNTKLRDVAQRLVDTGVTPQDPRRDAPGATRGTGGAAGPPGGATPAAPEG